MAAISPSNEKSSGLIAWFVYNPIAANLMMIFIIIVGALSAINIDKKALPDFITETVSITVIYPGSGPKEVEQGVILKIEQAISDVKGIKRVQSTASEGLAQVNVKIETGYDIFQLLDDIKLKVDGISTFPARAERPIIERQELTLQVLWLSISGDLSLKDLKEQTYDIKDELLVLDGIENIKIVGDTAYEIAIEVNKLQLKEYQLTIADIAQAIRNSSIDMTTGTVKTAQGNILIRTSGQAYSGDEFAKIPLRSTDDGSQLLLGDVAVIKDGFEEKAIFARFNGKPSLNLQIMSSSQASDTDIAKAVHEYVANKQKSLPQGVTITAWSDLSKYLTARLNMMLSNLVSGAVLVFLMLALFLRLRIALWVVVGIPVSFLGAIWLMGLDPFSTSINLISLFAFILVLGVVVDDAIIVGESVHQQIEHDGMSKEAVIKGAQAVASPATFGVLTSLAAFAPLLFVDGSLKPFFGTVSIVVSLCLLFSLLESKFILPAHLAGISFDKDKSSTNFFYRLQNSFQKKFERYVKSAYQPFLRKLLNKPYQSLASFISILIITFGVMGSGWLRYEFYPSVPSEFIRATVVVNQSASENKRNEVIYKLEQSLMAISDEYQQERAQSGENVEPLIKELLVFVTDEHSGQLVAELSSNEVRELDVISVANKWRERVGRIPGVKELRFIGSTNTGGGSPVDFKLSGKDQQQLELASRDILAKLNAINGVFDVRSNSSFGRKELNIELKPQAQIFGLNRTEIARQVRNAFFGEEVQRVQNGRNEVKVMVRYPLEQRSSLAELDDIWLLNNKDERIPFSSVASASISTGYNSINRIDRQLSISILADINSSIIESRKVNTMIKNDFIPTIMNKYPDIRFHLDGSSAEQGESLAMLGVMSLISLFVIYALIAIPLKSYKLPLLVLCVIPFGIVGAVIGHLIFDRAMSMMSLLGIIALSGVVVNDSIILLDRINKIKESLAVTKDNIIDVLLDAGATRFKAIFLAAMTTFVGLLPIMTETSLQAQFVIPMAISLAFGVLFSSFITLLLLPVLVKIGSKV